MKKKTTKNLLLPTLLMALCITFIKAPVILPTVPEDVQTQVMPCSNLPDGQNSNDD